jgi:hypothetical protein
MFYLSCELVTEGHERMPEPEITNVNFSVISLAVIQKVVVISGVFP